MANSVRAALSFLTILPVDEADLESVGRAAFLFPLVGLLLGAISGTVLWLTSFVLPQPLSALLALVVLQVLTGLHHLDGLLDFSDAVMVVGPPEKKRAALRDQRRGTAAIFSGVASIALAWSALCSFSGFASLQALIASEVAAKLSMVFSAYIGKPVDQGLGSVFIKTARNSYNLPAAILLALLPLVVSGFVTIAALVAALICASLLVAYSNKAFGGVTGDVFGAINELSRIASLVVLAALMPITSLWLPIQQFLAG